MTFSFEKISLKKSHPNSALLKLTGVNGRYLEIIAESVGGSVINIASIDVLSANFSGDNPTIIVHNMDQPGHVAEVTSMLSLKSVNIASMQLYRANRGGDAVMILECDQEIPLEALKWLEKLEGAYYSLV